MAHHALIFTCNDSWDLYRCRISGGHRIATVLREEGWDVEVIDFVSFWSLLELKALVQSRTTSKTVFFGFSSFASSWSDNLSSLTDWMKQKFPNVKTVVGGQHVSFTPATSIDYWVDSYGEVAILELVKAMIGNTNAGLKFDPTSFGSRKVIMSNQSYPAFPMNSLKVIMEKRDYVQPYEWLSTEVGRGCKFKCTYCNYPVLGVKGDHTRSQEDFEYEMNYNYDTFGVKNYRIVDETFNDSTEKVEKFASVVDRLNFKPFYNAYIRADLMVSNKDMWEPLARMRVGGHFYGVESFNYQSAKIVKKGMHPDRLKQGILEMRDYFSRSMFYRGTISLIIGLPLETRESLLDTKNWLAQNWTDQYATFFPLVIEKPSEKFKYTNQSEFYYNLEKYGMREMQSIEKYTMTNGSIKLLPTHTQLMWEHDNMNFREADTVAKILRNFADKSGMTVCSFLLGEAASHEAMEFFDIPDYQKYSVLNMANSNGKFESFVRRYINYKLSM